MNREDLIRYLNTENNIGIELGVAEGKFSKTLLDTNKFKYIYSVDRYTGERGHDTKQYIKALKTLKEHETKNSLLRMNFCEALDFFEDNTFDFIYIDGYAHTGENEGKTLYDWYPKLKKGGMFAGDDYHSDWPKVIHHVDKFCKDNFLKLHIHKFKNKNNDYSKYPSWYVFKN